MTKTVITKATQNDKTEILRKAVSKTGGNGYAYMFDYDDSHVYYEQWEKDEYKTFKSAYTFDGTSAEVSEEKVEVVRTTEYKEISTTKSLEEKMVAVLHKYFGGSQNEPKQIIKQLDDEQMIAIEPLYIAIGDVDGVGDTYSEPEVCHEMVKSFNQAIADGKLKGNYFHKMMTEDFTVLKAWVTETDCIIGETEVKEGMPLVKVKFHNEKAWELRKSGDLKGVSIGAMATWEDVE